MLADEKDALTAPHGNQSSDFDVEGQYAVVREIGHGAFAVVKEVYEKGQRQGRHTALKITKLDTISRAMGYANEALRDRLAFMLVFTESLQTRHIIVFYGWRTSKTHLFVFLEMLYGGDLYGRITESPGRHLTEDEARRVARALVEALEEAHRGGVIHRDVKPENVFYRSKHDDVGDVVLGDFGCCIHDVRPGQQFLGVAGSPGYVAPEMAAGLPYDSQVDIFSLGILCYEALTGRSPFVSLDSEELQSEVIIRDIPFPRRYWSQISRDAIDCVRCMTQRSPSERWTAAQLLEHPWLKSKDSHRKLITSEESEGLSDSSSAGSGELLARVSTRKTTRGGYVDVATCSDPVKALESSSTRLSSSESDQSEEPEVDTKLILTAPRSLTTTQTARLSGLSAHMDDSESKHAPPDQMHP